MKKSGLLTRHQAACAISPLWGPAVGRARTTAPGGPSHIRLDALAALEKSLGLRVTLK